MEDNKKTNRNNALVEPFNLKIVDIVKVGGLIVPLKKCILARQFSYLTLKNWVDKGVVPALRIGSRWYTNDEIIGEWLGANQSNIEFMSGVRGPKPKKVAVQEKQQIEQNDCY